MNERLLRSLPLVVAALALAVASHEPVAPLLLVVLALVSVLVSFRVPIDQATQRVAMLVGIVLTVVGIRASGMPLRGPHLGAFGYGFALAPLVLGVFHLWVLAAEGGYRVEVALGLVSVLVTGFARPGKLAYLAFFVAFVATTILVQGRDEPPRLRVSALSPRTRRIGAALLLTAATTAVAVALLTIGAYGQIQRRFRHAFETAYENQGGFTDNVSLGQMAAMLSSNAVVLRVEGPVVDRLRGVVLDEYGGGRWSHARREDLMPREVPRVHPAGSDVVEVRHIELDHAHLFLPLDAQDIASPDGAIRGDSLGAASALATGDSSPIVWFRAGSRDTLPVADPRPEDLLMPHSLRRPLTVIATEWTRDATTPEEALAALQAHLLRDYAYSLERRPEPALDPILDFLIVSRKGHCEYFASALVLLARTLGIPARLVLGYRVGEHNPLLAHYVVRKRNAHAWVEAYVPSGRWVTVDPTPMTELPQDLLHDESGAAAVLEGIAVGWEHVERWLAKRSVFELGTAAVLGVVLFAAQRWRRTRRRDATEIDDGLGFAPPLAAFVRLEAELGRRGLGRAPSEPIERWADRLPRAELASVLRRYAEARYGDVGDAGSEGLEAELDARASGMGSPSS